MSVRVEGAGEGSVVLVWSPNQEGDLAGYRVYRAEGSAQGPFRIAGETSVAAFIDSGLEYTTTYFFAVTAFDRSGNESGRSNVDSAVPANNFPPSPVGTFRVQAHNREDGVFVSLTWRPNVLGYLLEGDVQGFYIYRSTDSSFVQSARTLHDSTAAARYRDSTGVLVGTPLYYRVSAYDRGWLESEPTEVRGDVPLERPELVIPPDGATTVGYPTFRWHSVGGASSYSLHVSTARFSGEIWSATLGDTASVYGGPVMTSGRLYYWKVGAITHTVWDPNSLSETWTFRPE